MPTKLVKIIQRESGPFNTANNLCSIDFEPSNVTDLSNSYLNMEVSFKNEDGTIPNNEIRLGHLASGAVYDTACFIRHATLRSDGAGLIEQQRFVNVSSQTMKQYEMSTEEERADRIYNSGVVKVDSQGTAHLIVPLTKILGCASSEQMYPDYRFGQSRLELELESTHTLAYKADPFLQPYIDNGMDFEGVQGPVLLNELTTSNNFQDLKTALLYFVKNRTYTITYEFDEIEQDPLEIVISTVTLNEDGKAVITWEGEGINVGDGVACGNIFISYEHPDPILVAEFANATAAAVDYTTIVATQVPEGYEFHKGREYVVGYFMQTTAGEQLTDPWKYGYAKLVSATPVAGQEGQYTLVFGSKIVTLAAGTQLENGFFFAAGEVGPVNWEISKVDLVLAKPVQPMQVPKFTFNTNLVELVNLPGFLSEFRRQVELEQGVSLVVMINPVDCLIGEKQFRSFRNSVNSVDTITKDVVIDNDSNASIYYDKLMQSLDMLKRVQPYSGTLEVAIVPEKIMPEQSILPNNVVEFRLQTGDLATSASILYFFKTLPKVL